MWLSPPLLVRSKPGLGSVLGERTLHSWTKDQAPLWLLSPRHFSYSTVMGLRISWRSEHPQNPDPVGLGGARVCTGDKILMHVVPRTCCKGQDGPERRDPWAEVEGGAGSLGDAPDISYRANKTRTLLGGLNFQGQFPHSSAPPRPPPERIR